MSCKEDGDFSSYASQLPLEKHHSTPTLSPPPPSKGHNGKNKWQHILDWERSELPAAKSGTAAKAKLRETPPPARGS